MTWSLAPGVGFCIAEGELVFLDLRSDRYLALRGERRAAFERLRAREPNDSDAMTALLATGLFARGDAGNRLDPVAITVPGVDLGGEPRTAPTMRMLAAAARHLHWARRSQSSDRIAATVFWLQDRKRTVSDGAQPASCRELASAYACARAWVPVAPRCLVDSLALLRLMLARGVAPTLVFGVRLAPFAAHCWLQSPETILTGSVDDAHNFTPIFAL